ncbi:hypothetical protein psal_cds_160 [Pandoravirus salinus]|uniref:Uncharacterized protein n=1 Tax=Pandoravirus salinus TaxID=1349410 RepID=S4W0M0_9VIRU|nr:hypothetical protein psal_cds_160 [Pandoravirus salinus]AGO83640.1 hypothetical protein psal_cds_160 [Pandoravirus salinus]
MAWVGLVWHSAQERVAITTSTARRQKNCVFVEEEKKRNMRWAQEAEETGGKKKRLRAKMRPVDGWRGAVAAEVNDDSHRGTPPFMSASSNQTRSLRSPLDEADTKHKRKYEDVDSDNMADSADHVRRQSQSPPGPLFGLEQRCVSPHFAGCRRVLGFIDVGRTNMGLCFTTNDWHWSDPVVERVARVDIDRIGDATYARPTRDADGRDGGALVACGDLTAGRETADLVAQFVVQWRSAFDACERIFVERQPPGGMRDIEQLLYAALGGGARVSFLAPNSLHAHFRIGVRHGWGAYDQRKVRAETIASRYISANGSVAAAGEWATLGERRHDAADATLMAILVNERKRREWVGLYAPPALTPPEPQPKPACRASKRRRGAVSRIGPMRRLVSTTAP